MRILLFAGFGLAIAVAAWLLRGQELTVPGWALPLVIVVLVLPLVLVRAMKRGREREAAERSWLLERERQAAAETARAAERTKIAADLHDIVSHNVSVMIVQAGAARFGLSEHDDTQARDAMKAVEESGRDAMTELRTMMGLLVPSADPDAADAPQPGLDRLGPLLDRVAFAGLPVEATWTGERPPLPQGVDTAAYRVVQEALTNVLKHAPGASAEVHIRFSAKYVRLEVLNPPAPGGNPPANGQGRGLTGLAERIAIYGGDLHARKRVGGGFRVRARIPIDGR